MSVHKIKEIKPHQFRSLIEQSCHVIGIIEDPERKSCIQTKRSISVDIARATLSSDDFLNELRPLRTLNNVRLPVRRVDEAIKLLPLGYDRETRIFTCSNQDYFKLNLELELAKQYLRELLSEFCFKPDDRERSISVVVSYMLSLFCANIFDVNIIRPAFVFTANAEGSGKTLIAKLGIITRLGYCPVGAAPRDETERQKVIFAAALSDSPILFFDNVSGYLKSPALEALITSRSIKDRVLGQSKIEEVQNNLSVIITGNSLSLSPDLTRRSLIVELFLEQARAEDRKIEHPIDDARILAIRPEILSALWALVRDWNEKGQPKSKITHQTFVPWSEIVGGIVENAGFSSPCLMPVLKNSGDPDFRDMKKLVETMDRGRGYQFKELVTLSGDSGLFENLVPAEHDDDKTAAAKRKKFSDLLKKYDERLFPEGQRLVIEGKTQKTRRYVINE